MWQPSCPPHRVYTQHPRAASSPAWAQPDWSWMKPQGYCRFSGGSHSPPTASAHSTVNRWVVTWGCAGWGLRGLGLSLLHTQARTRPAAEVPSEWGMCPRAGRVAWLLKWRVRPRAGGPRPFLSGPLAPHKLGLWPGPHHVLNPLHSFDEGNWGSRGLGREAQSNGYRAGLKAKCSIPRTNSINKL